jgi:hypothetical protein
VKNIKLYVLCFHLCTTHKAKPATTRKILSASTYVDVELEIAILIVFDGLSLSEAVNHGIVYGRGASVQHADL